MNLKRFFYANTRIILRGQAHTPEFKGQGGDLFVMRLVGGLLTGLTFGVYYFWMLAKVTKWQAENTSVRATAA